jgi:hypothetical protein
MRWTGKVSPREPATGTMPPAAAAMTWLMDGAFDVRGRIEFPAAGAAGVGDDDAMRHPTLRPLKQMNAPA